MTSPLNLEQVHAAARAAAAEHLHAEAAAAPLALVLDGERIAAARFAPTGDATADAFLELCCREIEGLPREEAAAHGANYVVYRLTGGRLISGLAGIVPAEAVHPALAAAQAALRSLRAAWRGSATAPAIARAHFLDLPESWLALDAGQRLESLRAALALALAGGEIPDLSLSVDRIEDDIRGRPVRVTLGHPGDADAARLPQAMRDLERLFRSRVAPWIEVYAEERQDRNKLRQTILVERAKT